MISQWTIAALLALWGQATPEAGSISGVVVNASQKNAPVGEAEVVLRVMIDGQFVIAAEGVADEQGRFMFDNIPADADYIYLPGANHDGIHYPASRVRLSPEGPHASVNLAIHETITDPSPLVLRRHQVTIRPEADAIRVTEQLWIENPSLRTYIGHPHAKVVGRPRCDFPFPPTFAAPRLTKSSTAASSHYSKGIWSPTFLGRPASEN